MLMLNNNKLQYQQQYSNNKNDNTTRSDIRFKTPPAPTVFTNGYWIFNNNNKFDKLCQQQLQE